MLHIKVEPEDTPTWEPERSNGRIISEEHGVISEDRDSLPSCLEEQLENGVKKEEASDSSQETESDVVTMDVTIHVEEAQRMAERLENELGVVIKTEDTDPGDEGSTRKRELNQNEEAKKKVAAEAEANAKQMVHHHVINPNVTSSCSVSSVGDINKGAKSSTLQTRDLPSPKAQDPATTPIVMEPFQNPVVREKAHESPPPILVHLKATSAAMAMAQLASAQAKQQKKTHLGLLNSDAGLTSTTGLLEDQHQDRTLGEGVAMATCISSYSPSEYERISQENSVLKRENEELKKEVKQLRKKLKATGDKTENEEQLVNKILAAINRNHVKGPVKSPPRSTVTPAEVKSSTSQSQQGAVKSPPLSTLPPVEVKCSTSQRQERIVELVPGSGVYLTKSQMSMLNLQAKTKNAQQLLRVGLLMLFTRDELKNGCAVGVRIAHNKGTAIPSTPLDPTKLTTLKEFVVKKYKKMDKQLALEDKHMNRIINCKCSEIRKIDASIK